MALKICCLTSSYPTRIGKQIKYYNVLHELTKRIAKKGHQVFVVAPRFKGAKEKEELDGVKIERFGKNVPVDFRSINPLFLPSYVNNFLKKAVEVSERENIDLVHGFWAIPSGYIAYKTAQQTNKPFTVHLFGSDVFLGLKNHLTKRFVKKAINNAEFVLADGKSLVDFAKENNCKIKNCLVHSFEPKKLKCGKSLLEKNKKKWKIKGKELVLVVSRIRQKFYGTEFALETLKKLLDGKTKARLLLLGEAGANKESIKERIIELGVKNNVTLTGYLESGDYSSALMLSDIFLNPSLSDSTPVSLLEAMSLGLPVVSFDTGDAKHWVKNEKNGFVVAQKDVNAMAEAVKKLSKKSVRKKISRNNIKLIEKKCSWNKIIDSIEKAFLKATKNKN